MTALLGLILMSSTIHAGARVPNSAVACPGANRSPQLRWDDVPRGTQSFGIIMYDPDAAGGFYHWVAYNLPASTREIPENVALKDAQAGTNSRGDTHYDGPCPPPGNAHHYITTLYALNVPHIGGLHLTGPQLEKAMAGHIVARTSLTGLYGR